MKQYVCSICGYIYDEEKNGRWEELPDDWKCPVCRAGKDVFRLKESKKEDAVKHPKPDAAPARMHVLPRPFQSFRRNTRPSSQRKTVQQMLCGR